MKTIYLCGPIMDESGGAAREWRQAATRAANVGLLGMVLHGHRHVGQVLHPRAAHEVGG